MIFKTFFPLFFAVQAAFSSANPMISYPQIACSHEINQQGSLYLSLGPYQSGPRYPVVKHVSGSGQNQLAILTGEEQVQVIVRKCNSTALGLHYNTQNNDDSFIPIKLFLDNDESKCLQRFGKVHLADQNAKTHLIIGNCSRSDDEEQAKQFWLQGQRYGGINPFVHRTSVNDQLLSLILSGGNYGEILATNPNISSAFTLGVFPY